MCEVVGVGGLRIELVEMGKEKADYWMEKQRLLCLSECKMRAEARHFRSTLGETDPAF